ncbi:MAG TPA: CPBP family intramembrane glutamic endopeptidase [Candidatus Angelobacter sp.]
MDREPFLLFPLHPLDPITQSDPLLPATPAAPAPATESNHAVVDLLDVVLVFLAGFFSIALCSILAAVVVFSRVGGRHIATRDLANDALIVIPAQFVAYVLVVAFMVFIVGARHNSNFLRGIQWNMPHGTLALMSLGGGALLALGSQISSGLLHRWIPKSLPIDQYFKGPASGYLLAAFGVLIAPFVEEFFFRGFLYPALARHAGREIAVIATAAAFSLLHLEQLALAWAPLLILFAVGVVLTLVRARTNSVAICVLMHMGYNFSLFTMVFIATQGFRHMDKAALDSLRAALILW